MPLNVLWKNAICLVFRKIFSSVFFTTSAQLEALMDELNRARIHIETVNRMTEAATAAVENLEETAYRVVQNATLTEQLLQYSNRYRSFEPSVQESFDIALKLFETDYDYQGSFDEISYSLGDSRTRRY